MNDDFWKRHLEDSQRVARWADPLREFKDLLGTPFSTQKQIEALYRDPLSDIRDQMRALANPLGQLPAWLKENYGQEAIAKQLKELTDPYNLVADQFKAAYGQETIAEQIKALLDPFDDAKAWIKAYRLEEEERLRQWATMFDDFAEQLRGLPDEVRAQLSVLMDQGWCLDPEMPHTWGQELATAFQEGEHEEAQQWLMDYFKDRLDEIEQTLVKRHPERSAIIADAFQAHREGRYRLSIPVLLAQADGVIHDRHQRQLFSKKASANLTQVLAELPEDDMRAIFIAAFFVDIPLTRRTHLLPEGFNGLNRHAVLHGTDPSYGTEINSLRAVSILNLASYMVSEEEEG